MKMLVSMAIVLIGIKIFAPKLGESFEEMLEWMRKLNDHEVIEVE